MAHKPSGTRAVVPNEVGAVLLLLRPADADLAPSHWCLPGGALDEGEKPEAGARRELREETGLVAEQATASVGFDFPGGSGIAFLFDAGVLDVDGDGDFGVAINDESAGYGWFSPDALPVPLLPGTQEVIDALLTESERQDEETDPARPGHAAHLNTNPTTAPSEDPSPREANDAPPPDNMSPDTSGGDDANADATLAAEERDKLKGRQFAYPRLRKEPLENAAHVRAALQRFGQVEGATDREHKAAWQHILEAAKRFGVTVSQKSMPRVDAANIVQSERVNRLDRGTIGQAVKTPEGFLKVPARATRTGIFEYLDAQGKTRRELRLPEEVFDPESMSTLAEKPVTDEHPPIGLLDATTASRYARGWTGAEVTRDGDFLAANVTVTDAGLIAAIEQERKREVSCGYSCDLVYSPGVYQGQPYDAIQTNIRYNHLAVVPKGRAGSDVRLRMDAAEQIAPPHVKEETPMTTIRIDGVDYQVSEAVAAAYASKVRADEKKRADDDEEMDALKKDVKKKSEDLADAQKKLKDAEEAKDKAEGRADAAEEQLKTRLDAGAMQSAVKARIALEKSAAKILGPDTKLDAMDDQAVKVAVIKAVSPSVNLDGKSETYIDARFDAAIETGATRVDSTGDLAAATAGAKAAGGTSDAQAAREKMRQDSLTAWKRPE